MKRILSAVLLSLLLVAPTFAGTKDFKSGAQLTFRVPLFNPAGSPDDSNFYGSYTLSEVLGLISAGDITGVTAGTGLSGGGTSGDVTLNLTASGVTPGSYTLASFTVDAYGRITVASSGSAGLGDMEAATYDPGGVAGDAFDMDNMVESVTRKILTSNERTQISNSVTHYGTTTGNPHSVTKSDVGLSAVPNTDFTTPVGDNTTHRTTTTGNPHSVTKSDVGLSNVPNTDFSSIAQDFAWVGNGVGVATPTDTSGWDKNAANDLALGETSTTAYRGDRGKTAYDHSQVSHAPAAAEQNVQPDWNQTDSGADDFIKNKPTITITLTDFITDGGVLSFKSTSAMCDENHVDRAAQVALWASRGISDANQNYDCATFTPAAPNTLYVTSLSGTGALGTLTIEGQRNESVALVSLVGTGEIGSPSFADDSGANVAIVSLSGTGEVGLPTFAGQRNETFSPASLFGTGGITVATFDGTGGGGGAPVVTQDATYPLVWDNGSFFLDFDVAITDAGNGAGVSLQDCVNCPITFNASTVDNGTGTNTRLLLAEGNMVGGPVYYNETVTVDYNAAVGSIAAASGGTPVATFSNISVNNTSKQFAEGFEDTLTNNGDGGQWVGEMGVGARETGLAASGSYAWCSSSYLGDYWGGVVLALPSGHGGNGTVTGNVRLKVDGGGANSTSDTVYVYASTNATYDVGVDRQISTHTPTSLNPNTTTWQGFVGTLSAAQDSTATHVIVIYADSGAHGYKGCLDNIKYDR